MCGIKYVLFNEFHKVWYILLMVLLCLLFYVRRMRLCFSVTEAEVERAKNVFRTSLFMQLDGKGCVVVCLQLAREESVCLCVCL